MEIIFVMINSLLTKLKCWYIRTRYGSQLLYDDTFAILKKTLWHPCSIGDVYYRHVGNNLYYKLPYKEKKRSKDLNF
jgi:hypothetical protein